MKTYKISDIRRIAKDQGYTLAALDDVNGNRIVTFNSGSKKISVDKQLGNIDNRLKAEVIPDGVYYVLMAQNIAGCKNPDRYAVTKGKVAPEEISEQVRPSGRAAVYVQPKGENVLTYDKALEMQNTIATLTAENTRLTKELKDLEEYCEDLEKKGGGVSENGQQPAGTMDVIKNLSEIFKEAMPTVTATLDRHYSLAERKLDIEELKLRGVKKMNGTGKRVEIVPGSQEHLDVIEKLAGQEGEDAERKLNAELDKLQAADEALYNNVIAKLVELGHIEAEEEEEDAEQ